MVHADGFCLFDTALGACGLAWGPQGVVGAQLPEGDKETTRARMRRRFPGTPEVQAPPLMQSVILRVAGLLAGHPDSLLDVALDMEGVTAFHQRVYGVTRAIPPGRSSTSAKMDSPSM